MGVVKVENAGMAGRDQVVQTHIKAFSFYPEDNGESMKGSQLEGDINLHIWKLTMAIGWAMNWRQQNRKGSWIRGHTRRRHG